MTRRTRQEVKTMANRVPHGKVPIGAGRCKMDF